MENSSRGSFCYTNADSYTKVSAANIELYPLGNERGLLVKLIDDSRISDEIILEHIFAKNMINSESELICTEYDDDDGIKVSVIEEKFIRGSFHSSTKIINRDGSLSFEIKSSYYEDNSEYKFKLSE